MQSGHYMLLSMKQEPYDSPELSVPINTSVSVKIYLFLTRTRLTLFSYCFSQIVPYRPSSRKLKAIVYGLLIYLHSHILLLINVFLKDVYLEKPVHRRALHLPFSLTSFRLYKYLILQYFTHPHKK